MTEEPFWETRDLEDMSDQEWESLCDGCGRCCLHKLEDEDTEEVFYTRIACRLLDDKTARCKNYKNRFNEVPDCLSMRPLNKDKLRWLPESCAYRRLSEGRGLADWHPLISGSAESVRTAGIAVAGKTRGESKVPVSEWPEHVIDLDTFVARLHRPKMPSS